MGADLLFQVGGVSDAIAEPRHRVLHRCLRGMDGGFHAIRLLVSRLIHLMSPRISSIVCRSHAASLLSPPDAGEHTYQYSEACGDQHGVEWLRADILNDLLRRFLE